MAEGHIPTFLLRFTDGPLSEQGRSDVFLPQDLFGWPLPDRLAVLAHQGVENVAFWDADDPEEAKLPPEIEKSPSAVVYAKRSESQLPEDVSHVVRGAEYALEKPVVNPNGG